MRIFKDFVDSPSFLSTIYDGWGQNSKLCQIMGCTRFFFHYHFSILTAENYSASFVCLLLVIFSSVVCFVRLGEERFYIVVSLSL